MNKQQKHIVQIVILTLFTLLFAIAIPPRFVIRELKTLDLTTSQYREPTVAESAHYEVAEPEPDTEPETTVEPTTEQVDLYALSYDELNTYPHSEISKYLYPTTEPTTESESTPEPRYILTDDEKDMIMFVADSEDHSSVESRLAVMQKVINRVESDKFPDTVTEVLTQPKQFQVIRRYSGDCTPSKEALQALELLLYGDDIFDGRRALYFAEKSVEPGRIARGLELVVEVGGSKFWEQR